MASAGLLFLLLLMSSSLPISTGKILKSSDPVKDDTPEKFKDRLKANSKDILDTINIIKSVVTPFLGIIPVHGPLISAIFNLAVGGPVSVITKILNDNEILNTLNSEFQKLNSKLDEYHIQQKWDVWATVYAKPEMHINTAWDKFETLVKSLIEAKNDEEKRKKHIEDFKESYMSHESATSKLHQLLTASNKGPSMTQNFGQLLADHFHCHENDIIQYSMLINTLVFRGNVMNQIYYKLKGIQAKARVNEAANYAYECASVMLQIQKNCISNSMKYVENDVFGLIDKSKNLQQLAKEIWTFLEKQYNRYDWMVVVYVTKESKHKKFKKLNKHKTMKGFTEKDGDGLTVAVARQVKGEHTLSDEVKKAMDQCFTTSVKCEDVEKTLKDCKQTVKGIPMSETYTALHSFKGRADDGFKAKDEPNDFYNEPGDAVHIPYIYTGTCKRTLPEKVGRFVILVKSDEELMKKDPCSDMDCGDSTRGKCVPIDDLFLAVCECNKGYYGEKCEENLEDYKKALLGSPELPRLQEALLGSPGRSVPMVDNRRRNQKVGGAGV